MSLCDTCPKPGHCCRSFNLSLPSMDRATFMDEATAEMKRLRLPFYPNGKSYLSPPYDNDSTVRPLYSCTNLNAEGRCGDYENRPAVCAIFEPASDPLCILHVNRFKGIPIRVEAAA